MQTILVTLVLLSIHTVLLAQRPVPSVPLTYFVGSGEANSPYGRSTVTPIAVAVGSNGDIWSAGVAFGDGLPAMDPDDRTFSAGLCLAAPITDPFVVRQTECTDLFVVRLARDGSGVRFSKYLGGEGLEQVAGIVVDELGNSYLTGIQASSWDVFPLNEPYVIGLDVDGRTLLNFRLPSFVRPTAIGADAEGMIYIGGFTSGEATEVGGLGLDLSDKENGLIVKFDPLLEEIAYLTLLGGSGVDRVNDIAVDAVGRVYAIGVTNSIDFPITLPFASDPPGADRDIFVAALNASGDEIEWSASFGGSDRESEPIIELTTTGSLIVAGETRSTDFPLHKPLVDALPNDTGAWVAALDVNTQELLYSSYLAFRKLRDATSDSLGSLYLSGVQDVVLDEGTRPLGVITRLDRTGQLEDEILAGADRIASADEGRLIAAGSGKSGVLDPSGFAFGAQAAYFAFLSIQAPDVGTPRLAAVLNAASSVPVPLSGGMAISLYGDMLGPTERPAASGDGNGLPAILGGVRVLIGGEPAPLLFVSQGQVNAILPFTLGGEPLVSVLVERNGIRSNIFSITAAKASPAPFLKAPPSAGFVALLNQDGSLNSPDRPARPESIVAMWATGVGNFSPPMADGIVVPTSGPFSAIESEVRVEFVSQGQLTEIRYAGAAPGLPAGIAQINFMIPPNAPRDDSTLIRLGVGDHENHSPIYISIGL